MTSKIQHAIPICLKQCVQLYNGAAYASIYWKNK